VAADKLLQILTEPTNIYLRQRNREFDESSDRSMAAQSMAEGSPFFSSGAGSAAQVRARDVRAVRARDVRAVRARDVRAARARDVRAVRARDVRAVRARDVRAVRARDVRAVRGPGV
jgi:hypothetical protein